MPHMYMLVEGIGTQYGKKGKWKVKYGEDTGPEITENMTTDREQLHRLLCVPQ